MKRTTWGQIKFNFGIIIFMMLMGYSVQAQNQKAISIDSVTYQHYLNGNWDELLKAGQQANKEGIDFFYLQMRMGYAHFVQAKYRKAIKYYEKALEFVPDNIIATKYLSDCYNYGGRYNDALKISKNIHQESYPQVYKYYSSVIKSLGFFYVASYSDSKEVQQEIEASVKPEADGITKIGNNYQMPIVFLSHRIGHSLICTYNFAFLKKNDFVYGKIDGLEYYSFDDPTNQIDGGLKLEYTPITGLKVVPSFHYLYAKSPIYNLGGYGKGVGSSRTIRDYFTQNNWIYALQVSYDKDLYQLGASFSQGNLNSKDQTQLGFHFKVFPFANLNLYYGLDVYYQNLQQEEVSQNTIIHKHLIGTKVTDFMWLQLSYNPVAHRDFYDLSTDAVYNSLEETADELSLQGIFPLKNGKFKLIVGAGYSNSISTYKGKTKLESSYEAYSHGNINFSGGLIWNF